MWRDPAPMRLTAIVTAIFAVVGLALVAALLVGAWPVIGGPRPLANLLGSFWDPLRGHYGLAPFFVGTVVVTATAAVGLRTATVPPHEVLLWVLALVVVVSAAPGIWLGDVGFRSFDDLFVMSWVVILGQPAGRWRSWSWWPRLVATAAAAVWLGGFVELVRFI
jgi:hypothetical protein